ncbi:hypothetical protein IDM40_06860 [Nocardiopsis sp. HNM0947]|uniref:Uncharacterized protein n=1 Tax=Nocardiopsis coralli TaxID=2772213 RepID=A0ABR9P3L5_9ACTN|nr:hypothetical protein [Nocardiopsis coralli]MBE2998427.1 hypothetical protein [Nocardiopsis coralli]
MENEHEGNARHVDIIERLARSSLLSFGAKWKMPNHPTSRQWIDYIAASSLGLLALLGFTFVSYLQNDPLLIAIFSLMAFFYFSIWILPKLILWMRMGGKKNLRDS